MSYSRCFVIVLAVVSSTARADTLFVDNCTQPDGGDGVLFPSIQAAIDAAADGDEVVVAPCTYFETILTDPKGPVTGTPSTGVPKGDPDAYPEGDSLVCS